MWETHKLDGLFHGHAPVGGELGNGMGVDNVGRNALQPGALSGGVECRDSLLTVSTVRALAYILDAALEDGDNGLHGGFHDCGASGCDGRTTRRLRCRRRRLVALLDC